MELGHSAHSVQNLLLKSRAGGQQSAQGAQGFVHCLLSLFLHFCGRYHVPAQHPSKPGAAEPWLLRRNKHTAFGANGKSFKNFDITCTSNGSQNCTCFNDMLLMFCEIQRKYVSGTYTEVHETIAIPVYGVLPTYMWMWETFWPRSDI